MCGDIIKRGRVGLALETLVAAIPVLSDGSRRLRGGADRGKMRRQAGLGGSRDHVERPDRPKSGLGIAERETLGGTQARDAP